MAEQNKTGTAGQSAGVPADDLIREVDTLTGLINDAHHSTAYEARSLLLAAENLADCHRVLHDIEMHSRIYPEFAAELKKACPSAGNPQSVGREGTTPFEVIQDLLRVAGVLLDKVGDTLTDAQQSAWRAGRLAKGDRS